MWAVYLDGIKIAEKIIERPVKEQNLSGRWDVVVGDWEILKGAVNEPQIVKE